MVHESSRFGKGGGGVCVFTHPHLLDEHNPRSVLRHCMCASEFVGDTVGNLQGTPICDHLCTLTAYAPFDGICNRGVAGLL
jgi:hypothetical protein